MTDSTAALLTGLFGLLGVIAGSVISYVGLKRQLDHQAKLERARQEYEAKRERDRQARLAAEKAAERCEVLLTQLRRDIPTLHQTRNTASFDHELWQRVEEGLTELTAEITYLLPPARHQLRTCVELLRQADEFASDGTYGFHYHPVSSIVEHVTSWSRRCLSAFLNNETQPRFDDYLVEYDAALQDLLRQFEDEFAPEIAESDEQRAQWLAEHPQVAERLSIINREISSPDA